MAVKKKIFSWNVSRSAAEMIAKRAKAQRVSASKVIDAILLDAVASPSRLDEIVSRVVRAA